MKKFLVVPSQAVINLTPYNIYADQVVLGLEDDWTAFYNRTDKGKTLVYAIRSKYVESVEPFPKE